MAVITWRNFTKDAIHRPYLLYAYFGFIQARAFS